MLKQNHIVFKGLNKQHYLIIVSYRDGSCNGLQHYAALGRDLIGAQQVNLHPYDVPQDVYSGVAQMVRHRDRSFSRFLWNFFFFFTNFLYFLLVHVCAGSILYFHMAKILCLLHLLIQVFKTI